MHSPMTSTVCQRFDLSIYLRLRFVVFSPAKFLMQLACLLAENWTRPETLGMNGAVKLRPCRADFAGGPTRPTPPTILGMSRRRDHSITQLAQQSVRAEQTYMALSV